MRARNLKPSLFRNRHLAPADPIYTIIFEGLWCIADREGRLVDDPFQIHLDINPARAFETTEKALDWLVDRKFVYRYKAQGFSLIQVVKFGKHQHPHHKEPESVLPPPNWDEAKAQGFELYIYEEKPRASPGQQGDAPPSDQSKTRLIPDSGFRIPDSGFLTPLPPNGGHVANATANPGRKRKGDPEHRSYDETNALDLEALKARREAIGLGDFRDPQPGETASQYRLAQNDEHDKRCAEASLSRRAADALGKAPL